MLSPAMAQLRFTAQASTKDMGKSDYVEIQFIIENAKEIGNLQTPDLIRFQHRGGTEPVDGHEYCQRQYVAIQGNQFSFCNLKRPAP